MKWHYALVFFFLYACSPSNDSSVGEDKEVPSDSIAVVTEQLDEGISGTRLNYQNIDTLLGIYSLSFDGTPARIIVNYINHRKAVGYNMVKGLQRNLSGNVEETTDSIHLSLAEPGDHKADGVFHLSWSKDGLNGSGSWVSNSGKYSKKYFNLTKIDRAYLKKEHAKNAITNANFTNYFNYLEDSLGSLTFMNDGKVTYAYYPEEDTIHRKEQLESFNGTWQLKGDSLHVYWQPNTIFPSRSTLFKVHFSVNEEYYLPPTLEIGKRTFSSLWF